MNAKEYIKNFIERDEYLAHTFSGIPAEGGMREELTDGEEYEITIKMKHKKER